MQDTVYPYEVPTQTILQNVPVTHIPLTENEFPKPFYLFRKRDISGISGTGFVAEGTLFSNGRAVLTWTGTSPVASVNVYNSIEDLETIHCHGGLSFIVWK